MGIGLKLLILKAKQVGLVQNILNRNNKNIEMNLKLIFSIITIIGLTFCNRSIKKNSITTENDNSKIIEKEFECTQVPIPLDTSNINSFGYAIYDDIEALGPKSIDIYNNYIFIADSYFRNIKRIDLTNKEVIVSKIMPDTVSFPYDIIVFNEKLICADYNGNVLSFDLELKLIKAIKISHGLGEFIKIQNDFFQ